MLTLVETQDIIDKSEDNEFGVKVDLHVAVADDCKPESLERAMARLTSEDIKDHIDPNNYRLSVSNDPIEDSTKMLQASTVQNLHRWR
jgi:hypothetical protein